MKRLVLATPPKDAAIDIKGSVILEYGFERIRLYAASEYRDCLIHAFGEGRADFITLDSHPYQQGFTSAAAAWAVREGLLYVDEVAQGDQEQVTKLRLTDKGKEEVSK